MSSNFSSAPTNITPILQKAFQCYRTLTSIDITEYENGAAQLVFPVLPMPMLGKLCALASQIFSSEPNILTLPLNDQSDSPKPEENKNINSGIIIVGDLHGHILDLLRILKTLGYPPKSSYLFLGDIVDRGDFSTETAVLILLMKVLWPKNIYLIRGNHEFPDMWDKSGFTFELNTIYNNNTINNINIKMGENKSMKAIELFAKVFSNIPLAAILYDKILCVHGGIGPHFKSYKELNEVERPLTCYDFEPVGSVLWSDPSETVETFTPSIRGSGFMYGAKGLHDFLESQNLSLLIRGHQCAEAGVQFGLQNQVVTVFSASFYCGRKQNKSGVLIVRGPGSKTDFEYEIVTFSALRYIQRCEASFLFSSSENSLVFSSRAVKLNLPQNSLLPNPISPVSAHPPTTTSSAPEKLPPNANSKGSNPKSKNKGQIGGIENTPISSAQSSKALPHLPNAKPISNADLNPISSAPLKHGPCLPTPSPRIKEKAHSKYRSNSLTSKDFQQQQFNNLNTRNKLLSADSNDLYSNETLSNLNPNFTLSSPLISKSNSSAPPILRKNPVYEPSHLFPAALEPSGTETRRKGKSSQQMPQKPQLQKQQSIGSRANPSLKKTNISNSANNFFEPPAKNPSAMASAVNPRKKDTNRGNFKNVYRKSVPI